MNRIKSARKLNHLTQEQLAKALKVGRTTVTMWETSSQNPDNDTLKRISKILHVPVDYLIKSGVFENWEEIMENSEAVYNVLRTSIPADYLDPLNKNRLLIANLDIAFFSQYDELFLIQWFSSAVTSVELFSDQAPTIEFTPMFKSSIQIHNSSKEKPAVYALEDVVKSHVYKSHAEEFAKTINRESIKIPVLGAVPAGIPLEAIEDVLDWEEIPAAMCSGGREYFALRVTGDSMWPDYLEGDVVIVRKTPTCESGDVCVVYVNGYDATLKQVKLQGDGSLTIVPKNPQYPPRTFSRKEVQELPVSIAGVVVELRRKIAGG